MKITNVIIWLEWKSPMWLSDLNEDFSLLTHYYSFKMKITDHIRFKWRFLFTHTRLFLLNKNHRCDDLTYQKTRVLSEFHYSSCVLPKKTSRPLSEFPLLFLCLTKKKPRGRFQNFRSSSCVQNSTLQKDFLKTEHFIFFLFTYRVYIGVFFFFFFLKKKKGSDCKIYALF